MSGASWPWSEWPWSVADVRKWLVEQGMAQHATSFVSEEVDGPLLLQMMEMNLRDLGVTDDGARKRLYAAIRALEERLQAHQKAQREACVYPWCAGSARVYLCMCPVDLSAAKCSRVSRPLPCPMQPSRPRGFTFACLMCHHVHRLPRMGTILDQSWQSSPPIPMVL